MEAFQRLAPATTRCNAHSTMPLLIVKAHESESKYFNKRSTTFIPGREPIRSITFVAYSLPLIYKYQDLGSDILHNGVHVDIVPIVAEWILELAGNSINAVQGKDNKCTYRNSPPSHFSGHSEREYHSEQGKDLLLMNPVVDVIEYILSKLTALISLTGGL